MKKSWESRDAWAIFVAALVLRLLVVVVAKDRVPPTADGAFYHVVAQRIAEGQGYTWLWPDGAVTYAAHYPVGYPALVGLGYWLFGPAPAVAMVLNAFIGAFGAAAVHPLSLEVASAAGLHSGRRAGALIAGLFAALSPSLVLYTGTMMTEGVVGGLVMLAAFAALRLKRGGGWLWWVALAFLLGVATLVRPQCVLFVPVLGYLAARGARPRRLLAACLVSCASLSVVAPWSLRNCDKMERCVFVSANGGWNLLIGTFPEGRGAWVPLEGERVPDECREVYAEAAKDKCFGEAGVRRIQSRPMAWLSLVPDKLRVTFDHTAAAAEHWSAAGALSDSGKFKMGAAEIVSQRLAFLAMLFGAWFWVSSRRPDVRRSAIAVALVSAAGFLGLGVPLGLLGLSVLVLAAGQVHKSIGAGFGLGALLATAAIHGVFFGSGRYFLPLALWLSPLLVLVGGYIGRSFDSSPASGR